jgi:hypothetical protein
MFDNHSNWEKACKILKEKGFTIENDNFYNLVSELEKELDEDDKHQEELKKIKKHDDYINKLLCRESNEVILDLYKLPDILVNICEELYNIREGLNGKDNKKLD